MKKKKTNVKLRESGRINESDPIYTDTHRDTQREGEVGERERRCTRAHTHTKYLCKFNYE